MEKTLRIGGGTSTIRQFLQAGHIDEMHLAISPVFLGSGEHLFTGIDLPKPGFADTQTMYGKHAAHVIFKEKQVSLNTRHKVANRPQTVVFSLYLNSIFSSPLFC